MDCGVAPNRLLRRIVDAFILHCACSSASIDALCHCPSDTVRASFFVHHYVRRGHVLLSTDPSTTSILQRLCTFYVVLRRCLFATGCIDRRRVLRTFASDAVGYRLHCYSPTDCACFFHSGFDRCGRHVRITCKGGCNVVFPFSFCRCPAAT